MEADDRLQWSHLNVLPDEARDYEATEIVPQSLDPEHTCISFAEFGFSHDKNLKIEDGSNSWGHDGGAVIGNEYRDASEQYIYQGDECDAELCDDFDLASLAMAVEDILAISCPGILFSSEAIFSVLYDPECAWDAETAANSIRAALNQASECKPCRHLLSGGCYRKGCAFSHDLEHITCKYWLLQRGCSSMSIADGGTCPFQHRVFIVHPQSDTHTSGEANYTDSNGLNFSPHTIATSAEDFPSLPSMASSTSKLNQRSKSSNATANAATATSSSSSSFSSSFSLSSFAFGGPGVHIDDEYSSALKRQSSASGDSNRSYSSSNVFQFSGPTASWSAHHDPAAWPAVSTSSTSTFKSSSAAKGGQFISASGTQPDCSTLHPSQSAVRSSGKSKLLPSDWVDSGRSVAADYAALREDARTLAIARNALLEQATQAYLGGARDVARRLSAEGQELNRRMKQCHIEAAQEIFTKRNSAQTILSSSGGSGGGGGRLDLHGLHVAEAIECLRALLPALATAGQSKVTIVTGSGHHTKGPQPGRARLFPAVQALLRDEIRLSYREVKDDNGYVGGFTVSLR